MNEKNKVRRTTSTNLENRQRGNSLVGSNPTLSASLCAAATREPSAPNGHRALKSPQTSLTIMNR